MLFFPNEFIIYQALIKSAKQPITNLVYFQTNLLLH
jgi:hypothetical protein